MQDSFDPYVEWLGIASGPPENFYELLGLNRFEDDSQAIARAVETRIAQVRRVRPGPRVAQWQQLLDQLRQAKATLLDAAAKARYDTALRSPGSAGIPAGLSSHPALMAAKQASVAGQAHAPAPINVTAPGRQDQPTRFEPIAAAAIPLQRKDQGPSHAPFAAAPTGGQGLPGVAGATPRWAPRRKKRPRSLNLVVSLVLAVLVGVAAALGYRLYERQQEVALDEQVAQAGPESQGKRPAPVSSTRPAVQRPEKPKSPGQTQPNSAAEPQAGQETTAASGAIEKKDADQKPSGAGAEQSGMQPMRADTASPPVSSNAEPPENPAKTPASGTVSADQVQPAEHKTPFGPEIAADAKKQKAFREAAAAARTALSKHDIEVVRRRLQTMTASAQTDAEKSEAARLDLMVAYLDNFWKAMARVVSGLEAGEEFLFDEEPIVVVEGTADKLVLRGRGQNREYALRKIPAEFVSRLADKHLRDPESKAMYGVFLAVDPKGDPQRARQLWETAVDAGVAVKPLLEMDLSEFRSSAGSRAKRKSPGDP